MSSSNILCKDCKEPKDGRYCANCQKETITEHEARANLSIGIGVDADGKINPGDTTVNQILALFSLVVAPLLASIMVMIDYFTIPPLYSVPIIFLSVLVVFMLAMKYGFKAMRWVINYIKRTDIK